MEKVGSDINIEIELQSFDRSKVYGKSLIVIEQGKNIPLEKKEKLILNEAIPYEGYIVTCIYSREGSAFKRVIFSENKKLPKKQRFLKY